MHFLYTLWYGYGWPSLKGNGPEALIQTAAYAVVAVAVYPPIRKWASREERAVTAELHRKMDHIIHHHPDIPDLPPVQSDGSVRA